MKLNFKGLKVHKEVIPLDEEDKVCPVCGSPMERIGEEYVRRELVFTPAKCEVYEYYTESYGCPDCKEGKGDTEKSVIVKSKVPPALIGKGPASSSTVAWTIYQKYANGMPLYRQEKDWKEYGAAVSRTTLANWIIYSAGHYFRPLYDYFHRQLLLREFLMADETRVQVLKEPGRSAENGAPAGHISADTLWMRSRKESSWITTSRQYRECITATAWQDWKAAFPVSAERIMKKGNKCVSRRKNRFSRPFARG